MFITAICVLFLIIIIIIIIIIKQNNKKCNTVYEPILTKEARITITNYGFHT